jgi:hypothetical protein
MNYVRTLEQWLDGNGRYFTVMIKIYKYGFIKKK